MGGVCMSYIWVTLPVVKYDFFFFFLFQQASRRADILSSQLMHVWRSRWLWSRSCVQFAGHLGCFWARSGGVTGHRARLVLGSWAARDPVGGSEWEHLAGLPKAPSPTWDGVGGLFGWDASFMARSQCLCITWCLNLNAPGRGASSQPVGLQPSGSLAALAWDLGPTEALHLCPYRWHIHGAKLQRDAVRWNTRSTQPSAQLSALRAESSPAPKRLLPGEGSGAAHAPVLRPAGEPAPSGAGQGEERGSRGRSTDLIRMLGSVYRNIQEVFCVFNNENELSVNKNRFGVTEFVVAFIWLEVFSVTCICLRPHTVIPVTCWFRLGLTSVAWIRKCYWHLKNPSGCCYSSPEPTPHNTVIYLLQIYRHSC